MRSNEYKAKHREHERQKYKEKMKKEGKTVKSYQARDS